MKTSQRYIHEFEMFDDICAVIESTHAEVVTAYYNVENAQRQCKQRLLFEGVDDTLIVEKEGDSLFASIGNAIIALLKRIEAVIAKITGNVKDVAAEFRDDEKIVKKMIAEHPSIADAIDYSILSGKHTYKDISAYEEDISSLIKLFQKDAMDEKTFKDKCKEAHSKFSSTVSTIAIDIRNITTIMTAVPKMVDALDANKKAVSKIQDGLKLFKKSVDVKYGVEDKSKAKSILEALQEMCGFSVKEVSEQDADLKKTTGFFHKIAIKFGGKSESAKLREADKKNKSRDRVMMDKQKEADKHAKRINDIYDKEYEEEHARQIAKEEARRAARSNR